MKHRIAALGSYAGVVLFLFIGATAGAQSVPQLINFQGRLTDGTGAPVNGARPMRFSLLDGDTSSATVLWGETQASVLVTQGIYNVLLGSVKPIPLNTFSQPVVFLEVRVAGELLLPRQRVTSTAYAFHAEQAGMCMLADTLDGLDSLDFADAFHGHDFTDITGLILAGQVGADAITTLEIEDGSIAGVDLETDSIGAEQVQDIFLFNSGDTVTGDFQCRADLVVDGRIGVGLSNPSALLEVFSQKTLGGSTLDQQQLNRGYFRTYPCTEAWQSFTVGNSGYLTQVDLNWHMVLYCNFKRLSIYAGEGTGGAQLWSQDIEVPSGDSWQSYPIWPPIEVAAGSKYTIHIYVYPCDSSNCSWTYDYGNPYPNGRNDQSSTQDQSFKTYIAPFSTPQTVFQVSGTGEVASYIGNQEYYMIPKGGIIMWSGDLDSIPPGWQLCDGNNGAPDLRNRFIMGASTTNPPDTKGGANSLSLSVANLPSHNHSQIYYRNGNADFWIGGLSVNSMTFSESMVSATTGNTGSGTAFDNRPAFYALAFIMKK